MTAKNDVLIIVATHGDEKIGIEVTDILRQRGVSNFDVLIGNPKALKENKRFVDADLNRSYPGNSMSNKYEEVLAVENFEIAKKYKYIVDMHEASSGQDNFIIVPKETLPKDFPLGLLELKRVLLWPDPKGPMTQFLENGVELEFGMKNKDRQEVLSQAVLVVNSFLQKIAKKDAPNVEVEQEIFYVYNYLKGQESDVGDLLDFKVAERESEIFYPLLVGQYLELGIVCYKMKRV